MPEQQNNRIKNIIIVGGGSAGWMIAAALSRMLSSSPVTITLVESEQIGTIGVGEATIPDVINFNAMLGIPEQEFLSATNGTFKLGIEFINWGQIGEAYFHPFGPHGVDMQGIDFHQYWMRFQAANPGARIEDFSLSSLAAKQHKFTMPSNDPRSVLSQLRYAYHFDATAYARFLRSYAEQRGVNRVEGKVVNVSVSPEKGYIQNILLEDGTELAGDMFFDCTGFRGLLIRQALGVQFREWGHWLPCDTAQTVACERTGPLLPYTKSTAKAAGWQWRIPTQHRTGNGHIYASNMMGDDEAVESLLSDLDGPAKSDPRKIKFRTGHLEKFWEKNCVAIGLSGGFLEPLESTSLFLIQEGISKFISLFPSADMPAAVTNEYNHQLITKFEQVRDFIILHYKATKRDDSPFWNYCRNMSIPDSLQHKIDLFQEAGRVFRYEDELFTRPSWVAVLIGQNILPKTIDPIVEGLNEQDIARSLSSMRTAMTGAAQKMETHETYLKKYAWATEPA
ncbi:MAG: tryptophan halogenase family protein [Pseudomonadota bacterium]